MTQPLNYTPKAIADLLSYPCSGAPMTRAGNLYLVEKLRAAEVFVLSDAGELMDRSRPRPQVPNLLLKPPFPVVALEFAAADREWGQGFYDGAKCSRRISLAWEWQDDMPPALASWLPPGLQPGVMIASIAFYDAQQCWMPISAAMHLAYDEVWGTPEMTPRRQSLLETGRLDAKLANAPMPMATPIALHPEVFALGACQLGRAGMLDVVASDVMDEVAAYLDLATVLACKNVATKAHPAPKNLNRNRIKAGKLPLKGFHVLELIGGAEMPGHGGGAHGSPRSHLRRGHIRRLPGDRVTWVNSTIVRGRGFVEKVYAA